MENVTRRTALGVSAVALAVCSGAAAVLAAAPAAPQKLLAGKSAVIVGPDDALSRGVKASLAAHGAKVAVISVPALTDDAWDDALLTGKAKPGKVDIVVNLCVPHGTGAVGETTLAEFRKVIEGSYARAFLGVKYGIMALRASGGGSLINVTSNDGRFGNPKAAAASAASGGVIIMTKSGALECAAKKDNVRVNGLLIGELVEKPKADSGQVSADDVGAAIAFLTADAAGYLTGVVMPVDNGGPL